jgi:hypothetical protein
MRPPFLASFVRTFFSTSLDTLLRFDFMLACMFSGRHELKRRASGRVFVNRDGELFKYVLQFLDCWCQAARWTTVLRVNTPRRRAIANRAAAVRSANDSMKVATAVQARRLSPLLYAERKNEVLAASNKLTSIYATAGAGADVNSLVGWPCFWVGSVA